MTSTSGPSQEPTGQEWPGQVADRIETLVGTVKAKTTVPATTAARGLVFGLVAAVLAVAVFFLLVIGVVRLLDVYLPFHPQGRRVWTIYAVTSAIFFATGAFCWRKRRPKPRDV